MRLTFLILFLCTGLSGLFAQAGELSNDQRAALETSADELLELSVQLHTDSSSTARFEACKALIRSLVETLKIPNSYRYDFPTLDGVKIVYSPDDRFRLLTWELHVDRDTYRHYGAIQYNDEQLRLDPLIDRGFSHRQNPETVVTSNKDWLGYVAYDMQYGGTYDGQPYYLVFGYDRYDSVLRQKLLDVLSFDAQGQPVFGLPVFATYTDNGLLLEDRVRILLEYSAEAAVALRYDETLDQIVYENLILAQGPDGSPVRVPDGSYHALEHGADGRWHERSKVFTHTYEKAPITVPSDKGSLDIIGRRRQ